MAQKGKGKGRGGRPRRGLVVDDSAISPEGLDRAGARAAREAERKGKGRKAGTGKK